MAERIEGRKFPLEGKRIILTQTEIQIKKFNQYLHLERADPILVPCLEPQLIFSEKEMNQSLLKIQEYDWVIFTSQNAFLLYEEYLRKNLAHQQLHKMKIATIGHETKETIEGLGYKISFTPKIPKTSEEFFDQWMEEVNLKGQKILFPRSKRSVSKVPQKIIDIGAIIIPFEFYDVLPYPNREQYFEQSMAIELDWLTFSSPTAVNSFFSIRSDEEMRHWVFSSGVKIISIGPTTSSALAAFRVPVSCESPIPSIRWMIETMKAFERYENWDLEEEE